MVRKLILLLMLAVTAAGCAAVGYNDKTLGLSFQYPRGWRCDYYNERPFAEMILCSPTRPQPKQEGCCGPMVTIYADPWDLRTHSESTTAAALLAAQLQESQLEANTTVSEIQSTQIGGHDAAWVDEERRRSDGCRQVTRRIFVSVYGRTVSICACGPKEHWDAISSAVQDISASMTFPPPPTPFATTLTPQQRTVDVLEALLNNAGPVPDHLMQRGAERVGGEFDVNQVFSTLPHLSMLPGYVLDYVYFYEEMGGEPILYARPADQPPYGTYSDYIATLGVAPSTDLQDFRYEYLNYVVADGTDEGYFELVALRIKAEQFYQYWHAGYNDQDILCDRAGLEALFVAHLNLPADVRKKARELNLEPVLEQEGNTVIVRVVTFTKWGGFIEESYTIRRDVPHQISVPEKKTLVEYDCGFAF